MTSTRVRRTSIVAAVAAFALVTLSGCINITYNLSVNSDATLSGKVQLAVSKQAATLLGITNADDLNQKLQSGQLSDQTPTKAAQDCTTSEDDTNFILNCTLSNAKASDLNDAWTMTVNGDTATFHATMGDTASAGGTSTSIPGVDTGGYVLTLTYPGPISSVTGDRAVQSGPNTVTVKGSLNQPLDMTVVGSLSSSDSSSSSKVLLFLILGGVALLALIVVSLLVLRRSMKPKPAEQPALDGTSQSAAIESSTPEAPADADATEPPATPDAPQAPQAPDTAEGEPQQ